MRRRQKRQAAQLAEARARLGDPVSVGDARSLAEHRRADFEPEKKNKKKPRRQRRARREKQQSHQAARSVDAPKRPATTMSRPAAVVYTLFVAAFAVATMTLIGGSLPVLGHGFRFKAMVPLSAAAVLVGVAVSWWRATRGRPSRRFGFVVHGVAALVVVAFSIGAAQSVVINGTPYLNWSTEAQSYQLWDKMMGDLRTIAVVHDDLLAPELAQVRNRRGELDRAASEFASMTVRYAGIVTDPDGVPDPDFVLVAQAMVVVTDTARVAAETKSALLLQEDTRLEDDLATAREQLASDYTTIGPVLAEIAARYGFGVTASEMEPGTFE